MTQFFFDQHLKHRRKSAEQKPGPYYEKNSNSLE